MIVRVWIGTSSGRRGIGDEAIIPDVGSILVVADGKATRSISGGSILAVVCVPVREGSTIVAIHEIGSILFEEAAALGRVGIILVSNPSVIPNQ